MLRKANVPLAYLHVLTQTMALGFNRTEDSAECSGQTCTHTPVVTTIKGSSPFAQWHIFRILPACRLKRSDLS